MANPSSLQLTKLRSAEGAKILSRRGPRIEFYSLLIMPIEQDFLIFIGRIDVAPCDGEIGSLAIVYQVAKFDDAACAGKER